MQVFERIKYISISISRLLLPTHELGCSSKECIKHSEAKSFILCVNHTNVEDRTHLAGRQTLLTCKYLFHRSTKACISPLMQPISTVFNQGVTDCHTSASVEIACCRSEVHRDGNQWVSKGKPEL